MMSYDNSMINISASMFSDISVLIYGLGIILGEIIMKNLQIMRKSLIKDFEGTLQCHVRQLFIFNICLCSLITLLLLLPNITITVSNKWIMRSLCICVL